MKCAFFVVFFLSEQPKLKTQEEANVVYEPKLLLQYKMHIQNTSIMHLQCETEESLHLISLIKKIVDINIMFYIVCNFPVE